MDPKVKLRYVHAVLIRWRVTWSSSLLEYLEKRHHWASVVLVHRVSSTYCKGTYVFWNLMVHNSWSRLWGDFKDMINGVLLLYNIISWIIILLQRQWICLLATLHISDKAFSKLDILHWALLEILPMKLSWKAKFSLVLTYVTQWNYV